MIIPEFDAGNFTVGTLIGLLLGTYLGHVLAIRRGKIQSRYNAALKLKKEYLAVLLKLESGDNPNSVISKQFYHRQHDAAMSYLATIEGRKLKRFTKAFDEFSEWFEITRDRSRVQTMYERNDPEYLKVKEKDPVKLIENILKYANT